MQDSEFFQVPLTTVEQPKYEMGKIAFELLLKKIEKQPVANEKIIFKTNLVVRKSSGMCKHP